MSGIEEGFASLEAARARQEELDRLGGRLEELEAQSLCLELEERFRERPDLEGLLIGGDGTARGERAEAEEASSAGRGGGGKLSGARLSERRELSEPVWRFLRYAPDLSERSALGDLQEGEEARIPRGSAEEIARALGLEEIGSQLEAARLGAAAGAAGGGKPRRGI